jgi:hypothetical protein
LDGAWLKIEGGWMLEGLLTLATPRRRAAINRTAQIARAYIYCQRATMDVGAKDRRRAFKVRVRYDPQPSPRRQLN